MSVEDDVLAAGEASGWTLEWMPFPLLGKRY